MKPQHAAYLGNLEQALGDLDDTAHLLDVVDASLDSLGVVGAGGVEDASDLLVLALGPFAVHGTSVLDDGTPDTQQAEGDDCLLVDDIVLVAESVDGQTGGGGQDGGLGDERVARQAVDDGLGLLLGVLGGDVGRAAGGGEGGDGRESPGRNRWPQTGSPYTHAHRVSHRINWATSASSESMLLTDSGSSQAGRHYDVMSGVGGSLGRLRFLCKPGALTALRGLLASEPACALPKPSCFGRNPP